MTSPSRRLWSLAAIVAGLFLAGCYRPYPRGDIVVSIIGPELGATRKRAPAIPTAPEIALRGATGLGMLRLDEAAQLMPGMAARWAMIDEGPDGIFRIDLANGLSTREVAARLATAIAAPENRWFGEVGTIVPVTPTVIDMRLSEPRSELLTMLAMPALATIDPEGGPMRISGRAGGAILLEARGKAREDRPPTAVLRGERAGRAVARFVSGDARLVLAGTFADLPVARAAVLPRGALRFDRPSGLFGLVPADARSVYAAPPMLDALSLAIDRDRIASALGVPGNAKATTLAGSRYEAPLPERRARAIDRVAASPAPLPSLRVRMPAGPGAGLLFRLLAQDWARLGIEAVAVGPQAPADLALIDIVVPAGERARAACAASAGCKAGDKQTLLDPPYIAIGLPIRWALVAPELDLFTENALSVHPLDRLRTAR